MTAWLELLRAAVDASSVTAVARRVGMARSALSMALAGTYPASTDRLGARVMAALGQVDCPHLGRPIAPATCRDHHARPMPVSSPSAMQHWRACQRCPHRQEG